jgi:hypothetical protein
MKKLRIALLFVSTVAAILLVGAAGFSVRTARFLRHSIAVQGEVIANTAKIDSEGDTNLCPNFLFVTADGNSHIVVSSTCTNPASFTEHERARIIFNPSNPDGAEINSFLQIWFIPLVMGSIGLAWSFVAVVLLFFERRISRRMIEAA